MRERMLWDVVIRTCHNIDSGMVIKSARLDKQVQRDNGSATHLL